jgi:hypothetical protein
MLDDDRHRVRAGGDEGRVHVLHHGQSHVATSSMNGLRQL